MNTKKLLFVTIANIFIANNFGGDFFRNLFGKNNKEQNIYGLTPKEAEERKKKSWFFKKNPNCCADNQVSESNIFNQDNKNLNLFQNCLRQAGKEKN